jgi:hypothetical protein
MLEKISYLSNQELTTIILKQQERIEYLESKIRQIETIIDSNQVQLKKNTNSISKFK